MPSKIKDNHRKQCNNEQSLPYFPKDRAPPDKQQTNPTIRFLYNHLSKKIPTNIHFIRAKTLSLASFLKIIEF